MQKTRRLMDENSVSLQMFLMPLSFFALGSESQIFVFKQCQSNTQMSGVFCLGACVQAQIWRRLNTALRSVQFLASFISFYFEILLYLACSEKIIRLASKNSVRLGENQLVTSSSLTMLQATLFLLTCCI